MRLGAIMPARTGPHATLSNAEAFDVRVVSFGESAPRSLRGLRELFGIDDETAARLLTSVPAVVRRAAPANEAQRYAKALESIGAQVVLERTTGNAAGRPAIPGAPTGRLAPPPVPARAGGPKTLEFSLPPTAADFSIPPTDAEIDLALAAAGSQHPPWSIQSRLPPAAADPNDLPQPVMPLMAADLEFDVLSKPFPDDSVAVPFPINPVGAVTSPPSAAEKPEPGDGRSLRRHHELDLTESVAGAIDLELGASAAWQQPSAAARAASSERARPASRTGAHKALTDPASMTAGAAQTNTPRIAPMSRAELVPRAAPRARPSKSVPLLRVLGAIVVAVLGLLLDNSIAYGTANWFSLVMHGLALHQFLLGAWGLMR
jgi:hypothetical protein